MIKRHLIPWFIWIVYELWVATWRKRIVHSKGLDRLISEGAPLVFAHWHGDELAITHLVRKYRIATMTSTSSDGEIIDFVIRRFGGKTSRGSSTRGGTGALKGLVRLMRQGYRASMAVDGPKGPLHEVKPGVFELSRLAHAHIIPMGISCSNPIIFEKSWNKAILPKPFSRVVVVFGEPFELLAKDTNPRSEQLKTSLASALSDASHQAGKLIAAPKGQC